MTGIEFALHHHMIVGLRSPISPKPASKQTCIIMGPSGMKTGIPIEVFRKQPVMQIGSMSAALPDRDDSLLVPSDPAGQEALGVLRPFGDNIDDSVYGVHAPERRAGSTDDFNAVDVFEHGILCLPSHAGE